MINKLLDKLQKDEVKALLCHHGVEKSALSKKTVVQMREQHCQLKVIQKVDPSEQPKWKEEDEELLKSVKN